MENNNNSNSAKLLGGNKLVDCSHTIDKEAFTFVGCFPGVEKCFFKGSDGKDHPFTDARFSEDVMCDTRK